MSLLLRFSLIFAAVIYARLFAKLNTLITYDGHIEPFIV